MVPALGLVFCLLTEQAPRYHPATTPPRLAPAYCEALEALAKAGAFYDLSLIVAIDEHASKFQVGVEIEEGDETYLLPLATSLESKVTLAASRWKLRERFGTATRLMPWQCNYVKAAIRSLPELTNRIRVDVLRFEERPSGGWTAFVDISTERHNIYLVEVQDGVVVQILGSCFSPAPFAKLRPRSPQNRRRSAFQA